MTAVARVKSARAAIWRACAVPARSAIAAAMPADIDTLNVALGEPLCNRATGEECVRSTQQR